MIKKISLLFLSVAFFFGCGSSEETEPTVTDNFDRQAMLTNIADNIIFINETEYKVWCTSKSLIKFNSFIFS